MNLQENISRVKELMGFVNEQIEENKTQEFQNELVNSGLPQLTPEEISEIQPGCSLAVELPNEYSDMVEKYESMSIDQLKQELRTLKSQLNEQSLPWPTGGGNPNDKKTFIGIAVGILSVILLTKLFSKIFGGGGVFKSCKERRKLLRKFGVKGLTM